MARLRSQAITLFQSEPFKRSFEHFRETYKGRSKEIKWVKKNLKIRNVKVNDEEIGHRFKGTHFIINQPVAI